MSLTFEEEVELRCAFDSVKNDKDLVSNAVAPTVFKSVFPSVEDAKIKYLMNSPYHPTPKELSFTQILKGASKLRSYESAATNPPVLFAFPTMNKYFGGLNDAYTGAYQSGDKFIYASLISSIVTRTLLNPFERVKTLMQVYPKSNGSYSTFRSSWNTIIKNEGYRGLFRGNAPNLLDAYFKINLIGLGYYRLKKRLRDQEDNSYRSAFYLGAAATLVAHSLCYPIQVTRTRMYVHGKDIYPTLTQTAVRISGKEPRGFSAGYWPSILGVIGYMLLDLGLQKSISLTTVGDPLEQRWRNIKSENTIFSDGSISANTKLSLVGGLGIFFTTSLLYPLNIIRKRMHAFDTNEAIYKTAYETFDRIVKSEGYRGLFRGYSVHTLMAVPMWALLFSQFTLISQWCDGQNDIIDRWFAKKAEF